MLMLGWGQPRRAPHLLLFWMALMSAGCAKVAYEPRPLDPLVVQQQVNARVLDHAELREQLRLQGEAVTPWPRVEWDLNALVVAAAYLHPEMEVARRELRLREAQRRTAGQRTNPMVKFESEHHSDTSGGISPWTVGAVLDLLFEGRGRRQARIDAADAQIRAARFNGAQRAWDLRSDLRRRLLAHQASTLRLGRLQQQLTLAEEGLALLERRQKLGEAGAFEVGTMRLEMQRLRLALGSERVAHSESVAGVAAALGVPGDALAGLELRLPGLESPPAPEAVATLAIQEAALLKRADILTALEEYAVEEARLREAVAGQYPDINLSPGFLFDQGDKIWALGAAWVLPLFHNNEGPIAEGLARRALLAARFEALQAQVIGRLHEARAAYLAALEARELASDLVAVLGTRAAQVRRQLELGYSDRLELIRAEMELAVAHLAEVDALVQAQRALGRLEDAVQQPLDGSRTLIWDEGRASEGER